MASRRPKRKAADAELDEPADDTSHVAVPAAEPSDESGFAFAEAGPARASPAAETGGAHKKRRTVPANVVPGSIDRLEVVNFKSYEGEQTIGPFKSFQAVIGPNGSGKSNLMDAISFVLGVKSQHMRAGQLKDLIHRPEGAEEVHSKAIVRLVFKPAAEVLEGVEMVFERSVNAESKSTYRIDGVTVAWKDYDDALRRLGLLVKVRNFLVFQGDVESIAAKSPDELTELFEEISGSAELKEEYEAARKAKEAAEEDTIFSNQKRRGFVLEKKQFEQQRKEAEEFERLQTADAEAKATFALWELFHIQTQVSELHRAVSEARNEEGRIDGRLKNVVRVLKDKRRDQAKMHKAVLAAQKALRTKEAEKTKVKPALIKLRTQIEHLARKLDESGAAVERKEGELAKQRAEVAQLEAMLADITATEDELEQSLAREADGEVTLTERQVAEYNALKERAAIESAARSQAMQGLLREQSNDRSRLELLDAKIGELTTRRTAMETEKAELMARSAKGSEYISQNNAEMASLQRELDTLVDEAKLTVGRQEELQRTIREAADKLQDAKVDQRESSRAAKSHALLESLKRLFPGVHGRLSDLITPVHAKYNLAVSVAVGASMDSIVVDSERTAIDCIDHMRKMQDGNATFLPLDTIRVKAVNEAFRALGGSCKLVLDVVQCEDFMVRAVQYAVGNTVVCNELPEARRVAFGDSDGHGRKKVVTLNGTKITKAGLMTGGTAAGEKRGTAFDEKFVEGLKKTQAKAEKELAGLGSSRKNKAREEGLRSRISGIDSRLKHTKMDVAHTNDKLNALDIELSGVTDELRRLVPQAEGLRTQAAARDAKVAASSAEINAVVDALYAAFSRKVGVPSIREYEEARLARAADHNKRRLEIGKQKTRLTNQLQYEQAHELTSPLAELRAAIQEDARKLAQMQEQQELKSAEVLQFDAEIAEAAAEEAAQTAREGDLETEIRTLQKDSDALAREQADVQKRGGTAEASLDQIRSLRRTILRRCLVETVKLRLEDGELFTEAHLSGGAGAGSGGGVPEGASGGSGPGAEDDAIVFDFSSLSRALREDRSVRVRDELLEQMRDLGAQMQAMAPNLKAVERLRDVNERLKGSATDVEAARRTAQDAIDRFNDVKARRSTLFLAAFNSIKDSINEIYSDLTSNQLTKKGGAAHLSLQSPDEPYLQGVTYSVMPPSKRYREMKLLSGGEKTVASLALVFAIHAFRPSPFFVLDEVDAALDMGNVRMVAEYIRRRSLHTQMLIVSHKEVFFQQADALCGIYKDVGSGVSRTLTLDLRDYAPVPL